MKLKGFTLIELLAVIVILAIILLIAVPQVLDVIEDVKNNAYISTNDLVVDATELYMASHINKLPNEIGKTSIVELADDLQDGGFIEEVNSRDNNCSGYVTVTKVDEDKYSYVPSIYCSDTVVTNPTDDGLVAYYTFDDFKESTDNIIPSGDINAYPKIGNQWATYNTNQYNSNTYFSIGTIESVVDNVVTLSSVDHPIYTYDVLTPQITGGGVVNGNSYYIKKLSSNSFALYNYDGSQDGSKGFGVYDNIVNDIKVDIDSSISTMWYGPAHLPNSALVKEIIPNCFNSLNSSRHECIRLHTEHKPEGTADMMAYGVRPAVVSGQKYSISFYYRTTNSERNSDTVSLELYTSGFYWQGDEISKGVSTEWQRYELNLTAPASGATNFYFHTSKGSTIDISEIQIENKEYSTPFVGDVRLDKVINYSANTNETELSIENTPRWMKENNNGYYYFDKDNKYITLSNVDLDVIDQRTVSAWVKTSSTETVDSSNTVVARISNVSAFPGFSLNVGRESAGHISYFSGNWKTSTGAVNDDEWHNIVVVHNQTEVKFYIDGELDSTHTSSSPNNFDGPLMIGRERDGAPRLFEGSIDEVKLYKRALSEEEVFENYILLKTKFN